MEIIKKFVNKRRIRFGLTLIISTLLLGVVRNCEEDLTKQQVWIEYDAMSGCDDIGTTVFASELKDADTTRRLNSFDDNHDIPEREWLSTNINGYDSVEIFLENNRSEINFWGDDSQGIYVCAISRMVFISGDTIDSACGGITYVALDTSIYNDAMCALAVNTTRDSCDAHNIEYSAKMNYFTAHELGHAFNLSHCNSGCIMRTGLAWPGYYLDFCLSCETELGQQRP